MPAEILQKTRIAAWALNALTRQLEMGSFAHHFIGDDPNAWISSNEGVKALIRRQAVATIGLGPIDQPPVTINVMINNVWSIVRPRYLSEFDPLQYGIKPQNQVNWMGDTPNDIDATLTLEDPEIQIPGLNAPRNYIPQEPRHHTPKAKGSMDRHARL